MKTLIIKSSILGENSKTKVLVEHLTARILEADPDGEITVRELGAQPVPYLDGAAVGALFTPAEARTAAQKDVVAFSDSLVAELFAADRIVFAVPVYNFSMPAQLKSYIDHVSRAGVTFRYTAEGVPVGLVTGKEVIVLSARGGKAEGTPNDTLTPYLRQILGFLGMSDVAFIAAEGMAMGPDAAAAGLEQAKTRINELVFMAEQAIAA